MSPWLRVTEMVEAGVFSRVVSRLHGLGRTLLVVIAILFGWLVGPQVTAGTWTCADDTPAPVYPTEQTPSMVEDYLAAYCANGPPDNTATATTGSENFVSAQACQRWHIIFMPLCIFGLSKCYTFDAFGILTASTGTTPNRFLYCGEEWDANLNLYYNRARWMEPGRGRFWSSDTYESNNEDTRSLHRYTYSENDPIDNIDPSGWLSVSQLLGYQAEDVIEDVYQRDHLGDDVQFGKWTRLLGPFRLFTTKPDILNTTEYSYAEIKPLTMSGIAAGFAQMRWRAKQFQRTVYSPDSEWNPSVNYGRTPSGALLVFFNCKGLIFYFNVSQYEAAAAAAAAFGIGAALAEAWSLWTASFVALELMMPYYVGLAAAASSMEADESIAYAIVDAA